MRISDWSSDVCSSDLHGVLGLDHLVIDRADQPHPRKFRVVAEAELVAGRQLDVRIDRVDLVARTSARRDVLVVRVGAERRRGCVERAVRQRGSAVVMVRVGPPTEPTDAQAERKTVGSGKWVYGRGGLGGAQINT